MINANTNPTAKYYVCEGSADAGVTKVTPTDDAEKAHRPSQHRKSSLCQHRKPVSGRGDK